MNTYGERKKSEKIRDLEGRKWRSGQRKEKRSEPEEQREKAKEYEEGH